MRNLAALLVTGPVKSHITGIDWVVIAIYFGLLMCVAWWVVRKGKDTAADYFLAGRNLGWWVIGGVDLRLEHRLGTHRRPGRFGRDQTAWRMAHYELHAWCLLVLAWVFVPFYMRSLVFTMPEFLERRFSTGSRYVLSIVSLITFIVSKIAVGIFAGGVVFGTLLPEMHLNLGGVTINSFWIGSVLVIVLTGLYTDPGRHARGGLQRRRPGGGAHPGLGLADLRPGCTNSADGRTAALLRLGHVQPVEAADSRRRRGHLGAGARDQRGGQ